MYEIFAKLMKAKGCSAYQVSKATGIAQSTLSDWKSGKSIPKADKLQKIADYFGVSFEYLMTGKYLATNLAMENSDADKSSIYWHFSGRFDSCHPH